MTLKNNRTPDPCYFKLCASFRSHWWIQTRVTVWKRPICVKMDDLFEPRDLKIWRMKNNRASILSTIKLCASFHCHMWILLGVMVQKRLNWVLTSLTLTFDLWPWPFAWTSLLSSVIVPEKFMTMMVQSEKDRRTDRRTEPVLELLSRS